MNRYFHFTGKALNHASNNVVGLIQVAETARNYEEGQYWSPYPYNTFNSWSSFYSYFQTIKNDDEILSNIQWPQPWNDLQGVTFKISQENGVLTLYRIHTNGQYVTVLEDTLEAIINRLEYIRINGTSDHVEAVNNLDIAGTRYDI